MSRQSKARRTLRRKHEGARPIRRLGAPLQPHAQLVDAGGESHGGAGWRDGEWLVVLGGRVVARTDSAAMVLAMLRHAARVLGERGPALRIEASAQLLQVAAHEADALGHSLDDYLQVLEAERAQRGDLDPERALH